MRKSLSWLVGGVVAILGLVQVAAGETLADALAQAYARNPRLLAERANVRALDEEVARANSGYRPTVAASADIGRQAERDQPAILGTSGDTTPRGYGVSVTQPLFNGLRTFNFNCLFFFTCCCFNHGLFFFNCRNIFFFFKYGF